MRSCNRKRLRQGGGTACSHRFPIGRYGFHFTGLTANGVPLLELTQPAAVRRHGKGADKVSPDRRSLAP